MSYLPYNLNDKLRSQQRAQQPRRRRSPQNQYLNIKQGNARRINSQSEIYYQQQRSPYPYHKSYDKQRKFIEQSVFLPAINKRPKQHQRRHSYANAQSYQQINQYNRPYPAHIQQQQENVKTIDTQVQTMQYLNECERIITNLKKLTNIPKKKPYNPPYNPSYNPSYSPKVNPPKFKINLNPPFSSFQSPLSNYKNSVEMESGNFQRQPSFFGSIQDSQDHLSLNRQPRGKKNNRYAGGERQQPTKRYKKNFQEEQEQIPAIKRSKKSVDDSFTGRIKKNINSQVSSYDDEQLKVKSKIKKKDNGKSTADYSPQFEVKSEKNEEMNQNKKNKNRKQPIGESQEQEDNKIEDKASIKSKSKNLKKTIKSEQKSENQEYQQKQQSKNKKNKQIVKEKEKQAQKQKQKQKQKEKEKDNDNDKEKKRIGSIDQKQIDQNNKNNKNNKKNQKEQSEIENINDKSHNSDENSKKEQIQKEIDYEATAEKQRKLQQQLKRAQKRQKFLLKFLNKAKDRGSQLQRKITEHKSKLNQSRMTNKIKKEEKEDDQEEKNEQKNEQKSPNQKEQEKGDNMEQNPQRMIYEALKKQVVNQTS